MESTKTKEDFIKELIYYLDLTTDSLCFHHHPQIDRTNAMPNSLIDDVNTIIKNVRESFPEIFKVDFD